MESLILVKNLKVPSCYFDKVGNCFYYECFNISTIDVVSESFNLPKQNIYDFLDGFEDQKDLFNKWNLKIKSVNINSDFYKVGKYIRDRYFKND